MTTTRPDLLMKHFVTRTDLTFILAEWGKHCKAQPISPVADLVKTHALGRKHGLKEEPKVLIKTEKFDSCAMGLFRVATPSIDQKGLARWVLWDFDGGSPEGEEGHSGETLENPLEAALAVRAETRRAGLVTYLEKSSRGYGWHLWGLFEEPQTLEVARCLGLGMVKGNFPLKQGGFSNASASIAVEVFPKSFQSWGDSTGTPIWLPWYHRPKVPGANCFFDDNGENEIDIFSFETIKPALIDSLTKSLPGKDFYAPNKSQEKAPNSSRKAPKTKNVTVTPEDLKNVDSWASWRLAVVAAMDLDAIFSPYLTGKTRPGGWLECRDFRSSSGDKSPSAGVADGSTEVERGNFHSFLRADTISVFDYLVESGACANFTEACRKLSEQTKIPFPELSKGEVKGSAAPLPASTGKPQIVISDHQLHEAARLAWEAIVTAEPKQPIYKRTGLVVRIKNIDDKSLPMLEEIDLDIITGLMSRSADWYQSAGKGYKIAYPPKVVALDCLSFPDTRLKPLQSIVGVPTFSQNGTLITEPGYNEEAQIWYEPQGKFDLPKAPVEYTQETGKEAAQYLLTELFSDFPYVAECDKTHCLAALISPFVRRMISGPTPFFSVESPIGGTGKGLIIKIISLIVTGKHATMQPLPVSETEIQKKTLAELLTGRPLIIFDNADLKDRRLIKSGTLEGVLTSEEWTDREMGHSRMLTAPNKAIWFITGVNLEYSGTLMRRRIRIKLDPRVEEARHRRVKWRHSDIISFVEENRATLCCAVYVMVLSWINAGRPGIEYRLESFEHWSFVVGSILKFCGVENFCDHFDDPEEKIINSDGAEWYQFVAYWWDKFKRSDNKGTNGASAGDLNELCEKHDLLCEVRGGDSIRSQQTRFSRELKAKRGRIFDNKTVTIKQDSNTKTLRYFLEPLPKEEKKDDLARENLGQAQAINTNKDDEEENYF